MSNSKPTPQQGASELNDATAKVVKASNQTGEGVPSATVSPATVAIEKNNHKVSKKPSRSRIRGEKSDIIRKQFISKAYFDERRTQEEIGLQLGISKSMVSRLVRQILNEASDQKLIPASNYIRVEMEENEQIRQAYWEAWEREKVAADAEEILELAELSVSEGEEPPQLGNATLSTKRVSRKQKKRSYNTKSLDGLRSCSETSLRLLEIIRGGPLVQLVKESNDSPFQNISAIFKGLDPEEKHAAYEEIRKSYADFIQVHHLVTFPPSIDGKIPPPPEIHRLPTKKDLNKAINENIGDRPPLASSNQTADILTKPENIGPVSLNPQIMPTTKSVKPVEPILSDEVEMKKKQRAHEAVNQERTEIDPDIIEKLNRSIKT